MFHYILSHKISKVSRMCNPPVFSVSLQTVYCTRRNTSVSSLIFQVPFIRFSSTQKNWIPWTEEHNGVTLPKFTFGSPTWSFTLFTTQQGLLEGGELDTQDHPRSILQHLSRGGQHADSPDSFPPSPGHHPIILGWSCSTILATVTSHRPKSFSYGLKLDITTTLNPYEPTGDPRAIHITATVDIIRNLVRQLREMKGTLRIRTPNFVEHI